MTERLAQEYEALRATILRRGTARVHIFALGIGIWAALALAAIVLAVPPVATLVPLIALAASFEAVYALHVGVERIGRYLLVFHDDQWEHVAGLFGRPAGAPRTDALFVVPFLLAAFANLIPLLLTAPVVQELIIVGVSHAAFVVRVLFARSAAARQRTIDTDRFKQLRQDLR